MRIFHNRPLCLCCYIFACFAAVAFRASSQVVLLLFVFALVFGFLFLFLYFKKRIKRFFLTSLILFFTVLALISSFSFFHVQFPKYQALVGEECYIEGTVIKKIRPLPYESTFQVELSAINGTPCKIDAKLNCEYASALQIGDRFSAITTARAFEKDGEYDETASCLKEGMLVAFVCSSYKNCEIQEEKSLSLRPMMTRWNEMLSYRLNSALGREAGTLAGALLLGNRDVLDTDVTLAFERCGISHLLALSGLHVSILIGAFDLLLKKLQCQKNIRAVVLIVLSITYLALTGCAPSTFRAVLMFLIVSLGFYWKGSYDSLTALFVTLALLLFISPNAILDLGMWMSFMAAGSIVIFSPLFQETAKGISQKYEIPKWITRIGFSFFGAVFVGLVANLGLMLIQAMVFGRISLLSIPITMLLSVPLTLMLVLSILTLLLPLVAPLCTLCSWIMISIASYFSDWQGIVLPFNHFLPRAIVLFLAAVIFALAVVEIKKKRWFLLPIGLTLLSFFAAFAVSYGINRGVRFDYIQESGGDTLLFADRGKAIVVDFSDGSADGAAALVAHAYEAQCTEIEALIFSHYHNMTAHFIDVVAGNIKLRSIRLPTPQSEWESGVAKRLIQEAELHGVPVFFGTEDLNAPTIKIQAMEHELFPNDRHTALLLSVVSNGKTLVYANASLPTSKLLTKYQNLMQNADILIFGSTGFKSDSPIPFPSPTNQTKTVIFAKKKVEQLVPYMDAETEVLIDVTGYTQYFK